MTYSRFVLNMVILKGLKARKYSKIMIEVNDLRKSFGEVKALDGVSFTVNRGEILGLLGPNGAGKTTAMKILTSFWSPDSGEARIDGLDVGEYPLETKKRIGYLPETVPLYDDMTVYEYLKFVASVRGVERGRINERIREVMDSCGLRDVMRKVIEELSKGYRQRLGLAQAIIHDPEVLILDEPTTGLDPNQIVEIRKLIKEIGKEKTVIFSTHILGEVSATCDRVVIINNGRIAGEGSPDDLAERSGNRERIYVKIKGYQEDVFGALREIPGVKKVKVRDQEAERIFGYEIEPEAGEDIRERLSRTVFHKGWVVLELNRSTYSMEDIFRQLTS